MADEASRPVSTGLSDPLASEEAQVQEDLRRLQAGEPPADAPPAETPPSEPTEAAPVPPQPASASPPPEPAQAAPPSPRLP